MKTFEQYKEKNSVLNLKRGDDIVLKYDVYGFKQNKTYKIIDIFDEKYNKKEKITDFDDYLHVETYTQSKKQNKQKYTAIKSHFFVSEIYFMLNKYNI